MNVQHNETLEELCGQLRMYPPSVAQQGNVIYGLSEVVPGQRRLAITTVVDPPVFGGFVGEMTTISGRQVLLAPLNAHNAAVLRSQLVWLKPEMLGLGTSVGLGDRLGVATIGHLRALRAVGGDIAPIPAQQSMREMSRTGRSPQQVLDDAMWGVFAEGWRSGFGADADHLKTPQDIDDCFAAGYTFYTFDPGEHVDSTADSAPLSVLRSRFVMLPWEQLEDTPEALFARYLKTTHDIEGYLIAFNEEMLVRAAVKYGRAIAHVTDIV